MRDTVHEISIARRIGFIAISLRRSFSEFVECTCIRISSGFRKCDVARSVRTLILQTRIDCDDDSHTPLLWSQTQFTITHTTQKLWGKGDRLCLPSKSLLKEFQHDLRHSRYVISVSFDHCRNVNYTSWSTSCWLFKNIVLSFLESIEDPGRSTQITLIMIPHKNDDVFRHFYRRQNQDSRKSIHVATYLPTNSRWLKLETIFIDES